MNNNTVVTVNPVLLVFDASLVIGLLFGFFIPAYLEVQYYLFGFGVFAIGWVFLFIHSERIQKLHWIVQVSFPGLSFGIIISSFITLWLKI